MSLDKYKTNPKSWIFVSLSVIILSIFTACGAGDKDQFELNGTASGLDGKTAYLCYYKDRNVADTLCSVVIKDGEFYISGKIPYPTFVYLQVTAAELNYYTSFWLMPGEEKISIDTAHVDQHRSRGNYVTLIPEVKGSKEQELYESLQEKLNLARTDLDETFAKFQSEDNEAEKAKLEEKIDSLRADFTYKNDSLTMNFAKENNSSFVSSQVMESLMNDYYHSVDDLEEVMNGFSEEVKQSNSYKKNAEALAILKRVKPGQPALDFTLKNPEGQDISLSSLNGKVVLIDFWASWCVPCIASVPGMIEIYNKYNSQGFEILGVSNDRNKDQWLKAIEVNNMPWLNVVDRFPDSTGPAEVIKSYGIGFIPYTILLDKEGVIVAKNLHGKELEEAIKKIL